jgi:hypothetical protein
MRAAAIGQHQHIAREGIADRDETGQIDRIVGGKAGDLQRAQTAA